MFFSELLLDGSFPLSSVPAINFPLRSAVLSVSLFPFSTCCMHSIHKLSTN